MTADPQVRHDADEAVYQELGRQFAVDRLLGRGPLAAVYLARDVDTDRVVALKVIRRLPFFHPDSTKRFRRQAGLRARMQHPNVLPIFRHGESRSFFWYSMAPCRGGALGNSGTAIALHECLRTVQLIAGVLDYASRRGITHGDLRPANVLLDESGTERVADFGMLRAFGGVAVLAAVEWPAGALDYVAPEHLVRTSPVGAAADQYSLAVLAYECLAGQPPFGATSVGDLVARRRTGEVRDLREIRGDVPPRVAEAVRRAMTADPAQRFADVSRFAAALGNPPERRLLWPVEGGSDDDGLPPLPRRRWRWSVWALVAVLVVGAGAAWMAVNTPGARPAPTDVGARAANGSGTPSPVDSQAQEIPAPVAEALQPAAAPAPLPSATKESTALPAPAPAPAPAPVPAPAPAPGYLVVSAVPWAELWLDGRSVGNTPILSLAVPAGEHHLRLVRDGFDPYERVVSVAPGHTLRLTGIVLTAGKE